MSHQSESALVLESLPEVTADPAELGMIADALEHDGRQREADDVRQLARMRHTAYNRWDNHLVVAFGIVLPSLRVTYDGATVATVQVTVGNHTMSKKDCPHLRRVRNWIDSRAADGGGLLRMMAQHEDVLQTHGFRELAEKYRTK